MPVRSGQQGAQLIRDTVCMSLSLSRSLGRRPPIARWSRYDRSQCGAVIWTCQRHWRLLADLGPKHCKIVVQCSERPDSTLYSRRLMFPPARCRGSRKRTLAGGPAMATGSQKPTMHHRGSRSEALASEQHTVSCRRTQMRGRVESRSKFDRCGHLAQQCRQRISSAGYPSSQAPRAASILESENQR